MGGRTDPYSGREFALVCQQMQSTYVEITDPENPVVLGSLKFSKEANYSIWCDIKTYKNFAYIVSESVRTRSGQVWTQGVQVVDLNQLLTDTPCSETPDIAETTRFTGTGKEGELLTSSHNIFINEDSGFGYVIGAELCEGGLYILDLSTPADPEFVACYSEDGYTHDVQCVMYNGPDSKYVGREICFASNEDTVTIIDVTDKADMKMISKVTYPTATYTHQGWLTEDHKYFVFNDELDEMEGGPNMTSINTTMTYVANVMDLESATVAVYKGRTPAIDHNLYIKNGYIYQANYRAGLQVYMPTDIAGAELEEVAYFDIWPENDDTQFNAAWSNYPFFPSGTVLISGIEQGLFCVDVTSAIEPEVETEDSAFSMDLFSFFLNR